MITGPGAMTVADVAEAAGEAKGTTYLYFRSKGDLMAGVRARYLERFAAAVATDPAAPAADQLVALVDGVFDVASRQHDLHHALFHEVGMSETDAVAGVRARLEDILTVGVARGELAVDDVPTTAAFLLHGIHGALVEAMHHRDGRRGLPPPASQVADLVRRATATAPVTARRRATRRPR